MRLEIRCLRRDGCGASIQKFYLTNEGSPDTELFKLLPTQGSREDLFPLIRSDGAPVPDSQFKKAYDFFRRRLRDETDNGDKIDPHQVLEIIETCLMVVMINLSDSDDPYLIFESLISRVLPLEQADLSRNYFLMRFPLGEQPSVYEKHWLPMQNRLGATLTEFMRHFLGAEVNWPAADVYAAIKRLVVDYEFGVGPDTDGPDGTSLYFVLVDCRPSRPRRLRNSASSFDHFKRLDSGMFTRCCCPSTKISRKANLSSTNSGSLRVLHSFVIRRMVCGCLRIRCRCIHIAVSHQAVTVTPTAWLAAALGKEVKNRRWPGDSEFRRWTRGQVYGSIAHAKSFWNPSNGGTDTTRPRPSPTCR